MKREIKPLLHPRAAVIVPGSKSVTQRAVIIASLAEGETILRNPLRSEDTALLVQALRAIGVRVVEEGTTFRIKGQRSLQPPHQPLYLGNNGTGIRLLTATVALGQGKFVLTGDRRLHERPISPLVAALRELGVEARTEGNRGTPPVIIDAAGITGGRATLKDIESSQYVSALLIAAPYARDGVEIVLKGHIPSLPYIAMTVDTMKAFGVEVEYLSATHLKVAPRQCYRGCDYAVEGDASSASYFFLIAALTGGRIRVANVHPASRQGDLGILQIFAHLGVAVRADDRGIEVEGNPLVPGFFSFDLGNMPDMVPTLAMLAAMRPGRTAITHVAHLRHKESDRLHALATELRKVGVTVAEEEDGLIIDGGAPKGAEIETYNDHRLAMSFACLGLAVPGMVISGSECVAKSFPTFWDTLEQLRHGVSL